MPPRFARHASGCCLLVLLAGAVVSIGIPSQRVTAQDVEESPDVSPLPPDEGDFISVSPEGDWKRPEGEKQMGVISGVEQPADCSREAIIHYATRAPDEFVKEKSGLLYGVKTYTRDTAVGSNPGYNSCAIVVYAILKRAGCTWAKWTADARAIYDRAYEHGWRPAAAQPGCLVAWNSRRPGPRARIGQGEHRDKTKTQGVLYRHVGITTGSWWSVDNTSYLSRPSGGLTYRPFRYESPLFLCPPDKPDKPVKPQPAPEQQ